MHNNQRNGLHTYANVEQKRGPYSKPEVVDENMFRRVRRMIITYSILNNFLKKLKKNFYRKKAMKIGCMTINARVL